MSGVVDLPGEPNRGQPLTAEWGAKLVRALKKMQPRSSDTVAVSTTHNGTTFTAAVPRGGAAATVLPALVLTKNKPKTYLAGAGPTPEGIPIFVTRGVVGGVFPPAEVFDTPICYVTAAEDLYVWAKIGLSQTVSLIATSLEIVTSTEEDGHVTEEFAEDGTPPPFLYVPLGTINSTGNAPALDVDISNTGAGSIVVAMHITGITMTGTGVAYTRHLTYWRTADV